MEVNRGSSLRVFSDHGFRCGSSSAFLGQGVLEDLDGYRCQAQASQEGRDRLGWQALHGEGESP
jgi:hypothetical protein